MLITPHILAGTVAAMHFEKIRIKTPKKFRWLVYIATCITALISHLVLDRIPHSHYSLHGNVFLSGLRLSTDAFLGFMILFIIFESCEVKMHARWKLKPVLPTRLIPGFRLSEAYISFWMFWLAIFFCLVPDALLNINRISEFAWLNPLINLHNLNHTNIFPSEAIGLLTQGITVIFLWYILEKSLLKLYRGKIALETLREMRIKYSHPGITEKESFLRG
jgi:hypothetical protein